MNVAPDPSVDASDSWTAARMRDTVTVPPTELIVPQSRRGAACYSGARHR